MYNILMYLEICISLSLDVSILATTMYINRPNPKYNFDQAKSEKHGNGMNQSDNMVTVGETSGRGSWRRCMDKRGIRTPLSLSRGDTGNRASFQGEWLVLPVMAVGVNARTEGGNAAHSPPRR